MKSNVNNAPAGLPQQLVAALANVGEFTRMLHQLDAQAPKELQSDMHAAVGVWDSQQRAIAQSATDPLGGAATGLTAALFNSASLQAVDGYSADHCGTSIFGSPGTVKAVSAPAGTSEWNCPQQGNLPPNLIDQDTSTGELTRQLAAMSAASNPNVASAARAIAEPVAKLTPVPATSLEALGRLAFTGSNPNALLHSLAAAQASACNGQTVLTDNALNTFATQLAPAPISGGVRIGNLYGRCGQDPSTWSWTAPFTEIGVCGSQPVSVDLRTGVPVTATGVPADQAQPFGSGWVWATVEAQPASGLSQPTWSATAHVRSLTGSVIADLPFVTGATGTPPDDPKGSLIRVEGNYALLGSYGGVGDTVIGTSGKKLWQRAFGTYSMVTRDTILTNPNEGSSELLNLGTGAVLHSFDLAASVDSNGTTTCGRDAFVDPGFGGGGLLVTEAPSGSISVTRVASGVSPKKVVDGVVVSENNTDQGFIGMSPDGSQLWTISNDVAKSIDTFGRWLVVTNQSDRPVLVDPHTGADASSAEPDLAAALNASVESSPQLADPVAGSVIAVTGSPDNGNRVARPFSYSKICGN